MLDPVRRCVGRSGGRNLGLGLETISILDFGVEAMSKCVLKTSKVQERLLYVSR